MKLINTFIKSFKDFKPNYIHAMLIDFFAYFFFVAGLGVFYALFGYITDRSILTQKSDTIYILFLLLISLLTVLIISLSSAIFKRLSYKITNNQRISFKTYFGFSLIWTFVWFIMFAFSALTIRESLLPFYMFILSIIYIYFTTAARTNMTNSVKESFAKMFSCSIQIYKYILHIILMLAVGWIIAFFTGFIYRYSASTFLTAAIILLLLYITWARHYFYIINTEG